MLKQMTKIQLLIIYIATNLRYNRTIENIIKRDTAMNLPANRILETTTPIQFTDEYGQERVMPVGTRAQIKTSKDGKLGIAYWFFYVGNQVLREVPAENLHISHKEAAPVIDDLFTELKPAAPQYNGRDGFKFDLFMQDHKIGEAKSDYLGAANSIIVADPNAKQKITDFITATLAKIPECEYEQYEGFEHLVDYMRFHMHTGLVDFATYLRTMHELCGICNIIDLP